MHINIRSSLEQSRSVMVFLFQWYMRHMSTFSKLVLCLISVILLGNGVGQVGASAYFGKMDVPAHHSPG